MEDQSNTTILNQKSTQDLAMEGQQYLKDAIESAFQILSSMNGELCNPSLWFTSSSSPNVSNVSDNDNVSDGRQALSDGVNNGDAPSSDSGLRGGALDEAWLRYKSSFVDLRCVLTAIPGSRKELENKNKHLKVLIDQIRALITDVSTWQGPVAL